jgi:hypothetical protein
MTRVLIRGSTAHQVLNEAIGDSKIKNQIEDCDDSFPDPLGYWTNHNGSKLELLFLFFVFLFMIPINEIKAQAQNIT